MSRVAPDAAAMLIAAELRAGRATSFVARGWSMWPAVRDGATLSVTPCKARALERGDLAVYQIRGGIAVHRVQGRTDQGLLCRGDRLAPPFEVVSNDVVLGRAIVVTQPPLQLRKLRVRHLFFAADTVRANALGLVAKLRHKRR